MTGRFAPLLLLLLVAGMLGGTGPAVAQDLPPGIGIRLLEAPSDLADDPRAQVYVIDHVPPSSTIERRFEVTNGTEEPFTADLYAVGARIAGASFVPEDGRGQNLLATWVDVDPPDATIGPGARVTATLRIDVPADAPEGEHYGVVFAERRPDATDGVAVASRVGIRIYLSVGPGGAPGSDFTIDAVTASRDEDGRPALDATVHNTGGRALDIRGDVALRDGPGGVAAGPFDLDVPVTVAPGATATATLLLDPDLPDGPWAVTVTMRSGLVERVGEARLTFPLSGMAGDPVDVDAVAADGGGAGRVLALLLALLVSGIATALGVRWWRRRRGAGDRSATGPGHDQGDGGSSGMPSPPPSSRSGTVPAPPLAARRPVHPVPAPD